VTSRVVVSVIGATALVGLVALATLGPVFAGLALAVAVGFTLLALLGPEGLGTLLLVAAFYTAPQNDLRPIPSVELLTFSDVFFAVGFFLLVLTMLTRRTQVPTIFAVGAGLLVAMSCVASLAASDPLVSFNYGSRLIAAAVLLPLGLLLWRPSLRVVDALAWAYVIGQVVSIFVAISEGPIDNGRYNGLTIHPNFFALCAQIAAALLIHLHERASGRWRWFVYACGGLCAYAVLISGSRASLAALVLLGLLYPLVQRSVLSAYTLIGGTVVAGLAFTTISQALGSGSALSRIQGDATTSTSDDLRRNLFSQGWAAFMHSPFIGNGFAHALEAHNIYLQVAGAVGVFGLFAFVLLAWPFMSPLLHGGIRHRLAYAALSYLVVGFLTASLWDRMVWAGVALSLLAWQTDAADDTREPQTVALPSASETLENA
jgi:O-antigen ligase